MNDARVVQLQAQVAALSEEIAVLKSHLSDERWAAVAEVIEQTNKNFAVVNERINKLDADVRKISVV